MQRRPQEQVPQTESQMMGLTKWTTTPCFCVCRGITLECGCASKCGRCQSWLCLLPVASTPLLRLWLWLCLFAATAVTVAKARGELWWWLWLRMWLQRQSPVLG